MSPRLLQLVPSEAHLAALCGELLKGDEVLSEGEEELLAASMPVAEEALQLTRGEIQAGKDPLGDLFCALRPAAERREQGQFYTPPLIVESMCKWVLEQHPARAVDAGCGSGRYAVALRRLGYEGVLVAVDLDPLAGLMTRAHAESAGVEVEVLVVSFLDLSLPPIEGATAYYGNPPYLRHHGLPAEVKKWAKREAMNQGIQISGLAGLHALFFLAAAANGREGDTGSFITSSEWMEANYGAVVRDLLSGKLGLRRLDVVNPSASTFEDASSTAAVASFEVGYAGDAEVRLVESAAELSALEGGRCCTRERLRGSSRWSELAAEAAEADVTGLVPLSTHLRVSRGVATGANHYFSKTREEAEALGLQKWVHPLVTRAAEVIAASGDLKAEKVKKVLLCLPERSSDEKVEEYVKQGEKAEVEKGYICKSRRVWYQISPSEPADVLATYMARQAPLFALNSAKAQNLNSVHGLRRRGVFPEELVPVLVAWLNENREGLLGGRTYQGGLRKLEPGEMGNFLVPDAEGLKTWAAKRASGRSGAPS